MSIISKIKKRQFRYIFSGSRVIVEPGGEFLVGANVSIKKSVIYVAKGSRLIIGDNSFFENCVIFTKGCGNLISIGVNNKFIGVTFDLYKGECVVGNYNIISRAEDGYPPRFVVHDGLLSIGCYNQIRSLLWVRFGGILTISDRNAINQRTEIRSDKSVAIGSYNQISYDCVIWDTNTHNIYSATQRRKITDSQYPNFALEFESPKAEAVIIGDDCWIGRRVSILKGVTIDNKTIVAYNTTIVKGDFPANSLIVNEFTLKVTQNNI